jgi:flavorubredoxin
MEELTMEVTQILEGIYKFNHKIPNLPINFNQFLILGKEPLLMHTGNYAMAKELAPKLKEILGDRKLSYVFVSHFESDECGGINIILENFPEAQTICSQTTAMQFKGFGFEHKLLVKKPQELLETEDYTLKFISYPSEMHLWEGLLVVDTKREIIFSSDLFIRWDKMNDVEIDSSLKAEVDSITSQQIPSPVGLEEMRKVLLEQPAKYIAPGHGPFIKLV